LVKWEDILKVQVLGNKQKVKMGNIAIPTEDDTDCNRKLKEFADKLRNYNILLKERWEAGWPNKEIQELFGGEEKVNHPDANSWRLVDLKRHHDQYSYEVMYEETYFTYQQIPENVACKVLEILESETPFFDEEAETKVFNFDDWTIKRDYIVGYPFNINEVSVYNPASSRVIYLGWSNWENMTTKNYGGVFIATEAGSGNIYNISGYYDARKFGNNWHK
tara:strand:+ start:9639 stop:10298 length:660 start_codon:yes stop_codon:yes gene_type:complete